MFVVDYHNTILVILLMCVQKRRSSSVPVAPYFSCCSRGDIWFVNGIASLGQSCTASFNFLEVIECNCFWNSVQRKYKKDTVYYLEVAHVLQQWKRAYQLMQSHHYTSNAFSNENTLSVIFIFLTWLAASSCRVLGGAGRGDSGAKSVYGNVPSWSATCDCGTTRHKQTKNCYNNYCKSAETR